MMARSNRTLFSDVNACCAGGRDRPEEAALRDSELTLSLFANARADVVAKILSPQQGDLIQQLLREWSLFNDS